MPEPIGLVTDTLGTLQVFSVPDEVQAWLDSLPGGRKSFIDTRDESFLAFKGRLRQYSGWLVVNDELYVDRKDGRMQSLDYEPGRKAEPESRRSVARRREAVDYMMASEKRFHPSHD